MWKTVEVQKQEQEYNSAAQVFWADLYRAVQTDIESYNAGQHPEAHLSVGDFSGLGLNAKEFTAQHNQKGSIRH